MRIDDCRMLIGHRWYPLRGQVSPVGDKLPFGDKFPLPGTVFVSDKRKEKRIRGDEPVVDGYSIRVSKKTNRGLGRRKFE